MRNMTIFSKQIGFSYGDYVMSIQASPEVIYLLEKLFKNWGEWNRHRDYYLHTLLPELKAHPDRRMNQEKVILRDLKRIATVKEWDQLEIIFANLVNRQNKIQSDEEKQQQALIKEIIVKIRVACGKYNYNLAESLYSLIDQSFPQDKFNALIEEAKQRQAKEEDRGNFLLSLQAKLEVSDYPAADSLFLSSSHISYEEYIQIKSPYIQRFVQDHYSKSIHIEKAEALASTSPNLLLSARAGSGKTTVLACKTSMLIDCEQVPLDHILVMAFNRSAADEIRNRIRRDYKQPHFDNARTFHSLAYQLVQPTEDLLFDEKSDDVSTRKMSLFVQQLLNEQIHNMAFIEKVYAFFRKEMSEKEWRGSCLDEETYFDFRRNLLQVTLKGGKVKSLGEKYIADYLFEHDISYVYEKVHFWGRNIYRPDFSIYEQQKEYVIEFWGINEDDPNKQVSPEWSLTWDEYYTEMQKKRAFWKEKSIILIEVSIQDLRKGREAFEEILKKKLTKAGIYKPKLASADLIHKVRDNTYSITHISELFTQFIQRAKKQVLKAQEIQKRLQSYQPKDEREKIFLDLASRVYLEYEQALIRQQKIDFDDLMIRATEKVHETSGKCTISLGHSKSRTIGMNDLRWILIDEYQDFSQLFYRLITAIHEYNPHIRLFCVGDDWQAINGFAGSDIQFFDKFEAWVQDGQVAHLLTNFRSLAAIVQTGNALMSNSSMRGKHLAQNSGGDVQIGYIDDVWIECRNSDTHVSQKIDDERFLFAGNVMNSNDKEVRQIIASKYLKKCYQIITNPENEGKSIAILSRTNQIYGVQLDDFEKKLIDSFTLIDLKILGDAKNKIKVRTAHKYKGQEADLVIILGACNGIFPFLHPNNALFDVFGKTLIDVFDEERRLFYVALTRAKTSLYILTEKGRESVFLKHLSIKGHSEKESRTTMLAPRK